MDGSPPGPSRNPVGAQATGAVRLLRHRLNAESDALWHRANSVSPDIVAALAFKGAAGRARAKTRILAAMGQPPILTDAKGHVLCWRTYRTAAALLSTSGHAAPGMDLDKQDSSLLVSALLIGQCRGEAIRTITPWAMAFGSHALGRLLQRGGFDLDVQAAMDEAHEALLLAPADLAPTLLGLRGDRPPDTTRWAIPAAGGAFLASFRIVNNKGDATPLASCNTWVNNLFGEQHEQVAKLRKPENRCYLGNGIFAAAGMRPNYPVQMKADGNNVFDYSRLFPTLRAPMPAQETTQEQVELGLCR